jgi:hypothetical protein
MMALILMCGWAGATWTIVEILLRSKSDPTTPVGLLTELGTLDQSLVKLEEMLATITRYVDKVLVCVTTFCIGWYLQHKRAKHTHTHTHTHTRERERERDVVVEPVPAFCTPTRCCGCLIKQDGSIPVDNKVGRVLLNCIESIPRIDTAEFNTMLNSSLQDLLMVVYLSNLTRAQLKIAEKLQNVF